MIATDAIAPTTQAASMPYQRRRPMPRRISRACSINSSMVTTSATIYRQMGRHGGRSEPALRNDQHVARPHLHVGGDVAAFDQILQAHAVGLAIVLPAHQHGSVA